MDIELLEDPLHDSPCEIFLGDRKRRPTVTAVYFLSETLLVAAHRCAAYVYLIKFDIQRKSHTILSKVRCQVNEYIHYPDTMTVHNNIVYVACYSQNIIRIQIVNQRELRILGTVAIPYNVSFHGIKAYNGRIYATPSEDRTSPHSETIVCIDPKTRAIHGIPFSEPYRIKAIAFFSDNRVILSLSARLEVSMDVKGCIVDSAIALCDASLSILDMVSFPKTQFDSITTDGNVFYVAGANLDGGQICKGQLVENRLSSIEMVPVHDFAHGIAVFQSKVYAYTSYSTSAIHIQTKPF